MTIREAITQRIERIRLPHWADPGAYLRLRYGVKGVLPWMELYDPAGQRACDIAVGSQKVLVLIHEEDEGFEPYTGQPNGAEKGKA